MKIFHLLPWSLRQPVQLFPDVEQIQPLDLGLDEDIMERPKVLFKAGCLSAAEQK